MPAVRPTFAKHLHRPMGRRAGAALACAAALVAGPAGATGPHVHGQATLEVAVDGSRLSVALHAPQEALLGFERPPRGAAEHRAAERLLVRLKDGSALVKTTLAAGCVLAGERVDAPMLKVGAKAGGEHADVQASWDFECLQPEQLRGLDFGFFAAFGRLQRLEVLMVTARGQHIVTLARPQARVELPR